MRIDHRWPVRPGLLPGESFSSWFARIAVSNGLKPGELYRILQPGEDRNPRDLDRYADDHLIHRLADATGIECESLGRATFRRWAGGLFSHDLGVEKLAWLPPAGRDGGKRCFGQQVCPMCLAGDREPYLRQVWRLSFVTTCPVHGNLLLDRCQACGESFNVLLQNARGYIGCWSCGADIRRSFAENPPVDPDAEQRELLELLRQGWWPLGEYGPVYSFAAFGVLAILARFLTNGRYAHALRGWIADHAPHLAVPPETVPRAREGALLTPRARSILVPMTHWLMGEWPHRFVAAARAVGMTSTDLWKQPAERYPFAYADVVEWHLKEPFKGGNRAEVATAKSILEQRGRKATHRNLVERCGTNLGAMKELADPADVNGAGWGKGRYWKLDGVSPEVKAAARTAAHRAGEGIGPWLDGLLRRNLGLPARKTPCTRPSPDKIPTDVT